MEHKHSKLKHSMDSIFLSMVAAGLASGSDSYSFPE